MIQELVTQLPPSFQPYALPVAAGAAVGGAMLWVAGSRLSQSVVALLAVAVGGIVGLNLPRWFGWSIDAMGTVVGGAIVFGVAGYLFYRWVEGLLLGVLLAAVVGTAVWFVAGKPTGGVGVDWTQFLGRLNDPRAALSTVWQGWLFIAPRGVATGAAAGFIGGIALTLLWPRAAGVFTTSAVGVGLLLFGGVATLELSRLGWRAQLPESPVARWALPGVLIILGVLAQWRVFPPAKDEEPIEEPSQPPPESDVDASQAPPSAAPINPAKASPRPVHRSAAK
jgi:hypothetical protein